MCIIHTPDDNNILCTRRRRHIIKLPIYHVACTAHYAPYVQQSLHIRHVAARATLYACIYGRGRYMDFIDCAFPISCTSVKANFTLVRNKIMITTLSRSCYTTVKTRRIKYTPILPTIFFFLMFFDNIVYSFFRYETSIVITCNFSNTIQAVCHIKSLKKCLTLNHNQYFKFSQFYYSILLRII